MIERELLDELLRLAKEADDGTFTTAERERRWQALWSEKPKVEDGR